MSAAAAMAAVLRDGSTLDLLLRLQRGKPCTLEQIRRIAPPGVDLGPALTALEAAGLVRVARDGLEIVPPETTVTRAVADELSRSRGRMREWRDLLAALTTCADRPAVPAAPSSNGTSRAAEHSLSLTFVAGNIDVWWDELFGGVAAGVSAAIPDLARVRDHLESWAAEPRPADHRLLLGVGSLRDPALRPLVSALVASGARVRVSARVPTWLALAPAQRAALSADEGSRPVSGALVTENPLMLHALGEVFESWWTTGLALPLEGGTTDRALALRAHGLNDDDIARVLDVSARTLQRQLARLMDAVGVRSRFELGVWWATHGRADAPGADDTENDAVKKNDAAKKAVKKEGCR